GDEHGGSRRRGRRRGRSRPVRPVVRDVAGPARAGAVGRGHARAAAAVAAPTGHARHLPELGAVRPQEGLAALPAHARLRGHAHVRHPRRRRDRGGPGAAPARLAARPGARRHPDRAGRPREPPLGAQRRDRLLRRRRSSGRGDRRRRGGRLHRGERARRGGRGARPGAGTGVAGRARRLLRPRAPRAPNHRRGALGCRRPAHPAAQRADGHRARPVVGRGGVVHDAAPLGPADVLAARPADHRPRRHRRTARAAQRDRPAARHPRPARDRPGAPARARGPRGGV
ncbi:MAG: hypothetical protein AVDCRST_MAG54-3538, partial [uncultured Actinomycetospora sp.]